MSNYLATGLLAIGFLAGCDQTRVVPQAVIDASLLSPAYRWIEASDNDMSALNTLYQRNGACDDEKVSELQGQLEDRIQEHIVSGEDYLLELEGAFYLSEDGFIEAQSLIIPKLDDLYQELDIIYSYNERHNK